MATPIPEINPRWVNATHEIRWPSWQEMQEAERVYQANLTPQTQADREVFMERYNQYVREIVARNGRNNNPLYDEYREIMLREASERRAQVSPIPNAPQPYTEPVTMPHLRPVPVLHRRPKAPNEPSVPFWNRPTGT